ncbi:hypothetical protein C8Q79DRAFT_1030360 [Trametes meyenii]|nr:hypothetical protein C8Q79DRAFT_1030360 [Trametes meyenii]
MASISGGLSRLMPRSLMNPIGVNIAEACIESVLFGIFFVLAMTSLAVLVGRNSNRSSSISARSCLSERIWTSPLFIATIILLMSVTSHWLISVRRIFDAFVDYEGGQAPMEYYLTVEAPTQVVATAFVIASVIVGDIILTYRIWVVWDRRWPMIVFPTLCTMAYAAMGISVVELFATYVPGETIFTEAARRRVVTTACLTLTTNVYGTGKHHHLFSAVSLLTLASRRIDCVPDMGQQQSYETRTRIYWSGPHRQSLVIFIESAAFYTFWTLFFVVAYAANSLLEAFAFHCIPAATGISFMLIVVRVGLGFHWSQIAGDGMGLVGRRPSMRKPHIPYPPRAITLNVTRTIEQETDYALRYTPDHPHGCSSGEITEEMC